MLLIHCPYCEEDRPELEFRYAGEAHIARPADPSPRSRDEEFANFLFIRTNPKGLMFERWRHVHGCGRFFNAVRDTVTDKFICTYKAGEPKPDADRRRRRKPQHPPMAGRNAETRNDRTSAVRPNRIAGKGRLSPAKPVRFTFDGTPPRRRSPATRSPRRCSPTAST